MHSLTDLPPLHPTQQRPEERREVHGEGESLRFRGSLRRRSVAETLSRHLAAAVVLPWLLGFAPPTAWAQPVLPTLSVDDITVVEGDSGSKTVTFTIQVSSPSPDFISVLCTTANGTAQAGTDYQSLTTIVTIPANESTRQVFVTIYGDSIPEGDEQFSVNLSNPSNATIADGQGTCIIVDDDGPGHFKRFLFDPVPSPQSVANPFNLTVAAVDASGNTVPGFAGTPTLQAFYPIGPEDTILGGTPAAGLGTGNYTVGYTFVPKEDLCVTAARRYAGTKTSIWNAEGALIASQSFAGSSGQWTVTPFPQPVLLKAGEEYTVGAWTGGAANYYSGSLDITHTSPHVTIAQSVWAFGDVCPNTPDGTRYWYADFVYQPVEDGPASPLALNGFADGVWTGLVTLGEPGNGVRLFASDLEGHTGASNPFEVELRNNVSVTMAAPEAIAAGETAVVVVHVQASGPADAEDVNLVVDYGKHRGIGMTSTHGRVEQHLSLSEFRCAIGHLEAGEKAIVVIHLSSYNTRSRKIPIVAKITSATPNDYPKDDLDSHAIWWDGAPASTFQLDELSTLNLLLLDTIPLTGGGGGGLGLGRDNVLLGGPHGLVAVAQGDLSHGESLSQNPFQWTVSNHRTGTPYVFGDDEGNPLGENGGAAQTLIPIDENTGNPVGPVTREIWFRWSGSGVGDVPPDRPPDHIDSRVNLESPPGLGNNYAVRLSAILVPPETGEYTFWVSSDDQGELYLSTDETPAHMELIATQPTWGNFREWNKYQEQKSNPIPLTAGNRYLIEGVFNQWSGGGHFSAGWAKPGESTDTPTEVIPFDVLSNPDGENGVRPIRLSQAVPVGPGSGFFSGFGGATVLSGGRAFDINLSSGEVTDLGTLSLGAYQTTPSGNIFGIREHSPDNRWIVYVQDPQTIVRTSVPGGETTDVATFSDLGNAASIGVAPGRDQWFIRFQGNSQFGSGSDVLVSADASFLIQGPDPNQPPSFTPGPNVTVLQESGPYAAPWASAISTGGEDGQTTTFLIETDHPEFFNEPIAIDANGVLTFTPADRAFGTATVTVRAQDNGGNTSAPHTFTITIVPSANLEVHSTDRPVPAQPGAPVPLRITVFNSGGAAASDVSLNVNLPSALSVTGADSTQGEPGIPGEGGWSFNLGSIAPLGSADVNLTVTADQPGLHQVTANVTSSGHEITLVNNTAGSTVRFAYPTGFDFRITGLNFDDLRAADIGDLTGGGLGSIGSDWDRVVVIGPDGAASVSGDTLEGNPLTTNHRWLATDLNHGTIYAFTEGSDPVQPGGTATALTPLDPQTGRVEGPVKVETWHGVAGASLNQNNFNSPPHDVVRSDTIETAWNKDDYFATKLSTLVKAPETGHYTFWVAGDNETGLFLSTDANPANKVLIASVPNWTGQHELDKYPEQKSNPTFLQQGQPYYLEALQKEEWGGDGVTVYWSSPSGDPNVPTPIPTSALEEPNGPFVPGLSQVELSVPLTLGPRSGVFSGLGGAIVVQPSGDAYKVTVPHGQVISLGNIAVPPHQATADGSWFGVAENWGGQDRIVYVADPQTVKRFNIQTGQDEVVGTFDHLGNSAAWAVDLPQRRWFTSYEGNGQFGAGQHILASGTLGFTVALPPANQAPKITLPGTETRATEGTLRDFAATVSDLDHPLGEIVVSFDSDNPDVALPFGFTFIEAEQKHVFRLIPRQPGQATITITAQDPQGALGHASFVLHVDPVATPPEGAPDIFIQDAFTFENLTFGQPKGELVFPVELSAPSEREISVLAYTSATGPTATADEDFQRQAVLLVFPPGNTRQHLRVPILDDELAEGAQVPLRDPPGDQSCEIIHAFLAGAIGANVKAAPGHDLVGDPYQEGMATGYIIDDDGPGNQAPVFVYRLPDQSATVGQTFWLDVPVRDPDHTPDQLEWILQPQDPTVVPPGTIAWEEPEQEFVLWLIPSKAGSTEYTITARDPAGANVTGSFVLHVSDPPDPSGGPPNLSIEDGFVFEGLTFGQATADLVFPVKLDRPSEQRVSVSVQTQVDPDDPGGPGHATLSEDFHFAGERLVFPPGQTVQYFRVPVRTDTRPEGVEVHLRDLGTEYVEMLTAVLSRPINAEIIEAPGLNMRGLPYVVTEATGYIIDDDARANAPEGHVVTSPCPDLRVEILELFGNAFGDPPPIAQILPPPPDDPCAILVELVGEGKAVLRLEQGGRAFRARLEGPGRYRLRPGSVIVEVENGRAELEIDLGAVRHSVAVIGAGTAKLTDLFATLGLVDAIEVLAGGLDGTVQVNGFVLESGHRVILRGDLGGHHLTAGPDFITRPRDTRVAKVAIPDLLANDTDVEHHPLQVIESDLPATPAGATARIQGNFFVYVAPTATAGDGSFAYTVIDGIFGHRATGLVTVAEVAPPIDDPPANSLHAARVGDDIVVRFVGVPERRYRVQFATTLPWAWQDFDPPAILTAPDHGIMTFVDARPPEAARFYRIHTEPTSNP